MTANGQKTTRSDPKILPGTVIYDVDLTMTLGAAQRVVLLMQVRDTRRFESYVDLATVEALYGQNTNPLTFIVAQEGVRALATSLPKIMQESLSHSARRDALCGAWLCGSCLGTVSMSLHHKLCRPLVGSLDLSHAETHTVVLPHVLSYVALNIPQAMGRLAQVLPDSKGDAIRGLNVFLTKLEVRRSLRELGMKREDIGRAAEIAMTKAY